MSKSVSFTKPGSSSSTANDWVKTGSQTSEPMKRFTFEVPESLHRRVKTQCAERGHKMADAIRDLLEQAFPERSDA